MRMLAWVCSLVLVGCATIPTPAERRAQADSLAAEQAWGATVLPAGHFDLLAYLPHRPTRAERLTIYIEGDGLAWLGVSQPSPDPTPRDPLALRLALAQPEGAAAYLGRPCQYVGEGARHCASRYWADARFAPEVIAASNEAVDALKARFGANRLTLVGYSGGGAVAALLAARRDDVDALVTVAGNLDPAAWAHLHRVRQLDGSMDPASEIDRLERVPQLHFVGERDDNVRPELVQGFADRFRPGARPVVRVVPDFDHRCCWAAQWPVLWREIGRRPPP